MSEQNGQSQRKGSENQETLALAELKLLAFALYARCEAALEAGIPVIDPDSELGMDDAVTAPFRTSGRTIYAAVAAWEITRAWACRLRDHGLGVHVDYVMFRPIIENLLTAIWILGPADSDTRVARTLRAWESELSDGTRFGTKVQQLSDRDGHPGVDKHATAMTTLSQQLANVTRKAHYAAVPDRRTRSLSYTTIVTEAGEFIDELGPLGAYWVWSVSSGMTHGQSLVGMSLSNFDSTDRGHGDLDAEVEASPRVVLHYVKSIEMMLSTLSDLFHSRLAVISGPTE